MADVKGNGGDGDGGNQIEKRNKSSGQYVKNLMTKHTWKERSG